MAQLMTIARPYAEGVYALAKEEGNVATWSEELANLALISRDEAMEAMIKNPSMAVPFVKSFGLMTKI